MVCGVPGGKARWQGNVTERPFSSMTRKDLVTGRKSSYGGSELPIYGWTANDDDQLMRQCDTVFVPPQVRLEVFLFYLEEALEKGKACRGIKSCCGSIQTQTWHGDLISHYLLPPQTAGK